jgi:hypothetical protein
MAKGLKQRGHQLAPGQVAGATKQNKVKTHKANWITGQVFRSVLN